jgi:hypothetical protein
MVLTVLLVTALTIKYAADYAIDQIYDHAIALQDALREASISRE